MKKTKINICLLILGTLLINGCFSTLEKINDQNSIIDNKNKELVKQECTEKEDGIPCSYGLWYNKEGKACGGKSCVGLGLGKCYNHRCVKLEE